ncbi:MAG: hypothetical protein JSV24_09015, partial [Bacteroidales bacterium]
GELTIRRYTRYAEGGSGLIWFEATSIKKACCSGPRQLVISKDTMPEFKRLVEHIRLSASAAFGNNHRVYLVLQLTHSGRFSRPDGTPKPEVVCGNPFLDGKREGLKILSDRELEDLREDFIEAGILAEKAGFDAVDIKACHGYLIHEMLGSFTRAGSRFGGMPFENRVRFLCDTLRGIKDNTKKISTASRISFYDGIPYPYGFGVQREGSVRINLEEPVRLVKQLVESGTCLVNGTMGIPRYNPHVNRPFDRLLPGGEIPCEHPLEGVVRLIRGVGRIKEAVPDSVLVGTGYSWLRYYFPNVASAVISEGMATFIGVGRGSFAYPDAPKDLMKYGKIDRKKVCISCSRCTELMRHNQTTGCVIRDKEIYESIYKKISE